jgi:sporulation protein YlmC with PRC-barrel domain
MRRLSDLLEREVVTESGEKLGHCFDIRGERTATTLKVTGLVVGRRGFLERLGIGSSRREAKRHHKVWNRDLVPWTAVVRLERNHIVVKDGTTPK